jgi:hypothetical protein
LLQTNPNELTRIGNCYYQIGNFKTLSKVLALEKANGDSSQVRFHWMDDTWDRINMSQEPATTWDELLRLRAWQLREQYSHVGLFYSGGWDSHTALMAFVKNNIPLDEILLYDKTSHIQDVELDDSRTSAQQIIKEYGLKTRLTSVAIPWNFHAQIYKEYRQDWIYLPGSHLCFNKTVRLVQHEKQQELLEVKRGHSDLSACYIEAHDKPRVSLYNNQWTTFYVDAAMGPYIGSGDQGGATLFYFSDDLPELHLKQVHMSIRYFEYKLNTDPTFTAQTMHDVQSFRRPDLYPEYNRAIGRTCGPNYSAQHGLAKNNTLDTPQREEMKRLLNFTRDYVDDVYDIYEGGLGRITELTGINVMQGQLPVILSKQYPIRQIQTPGIIV